jgi:osmotically-inducible protein OsmY
MDQEAANKRGGDYGEGKKSSHQVTTYGEPMTPPFLAEEVRKALNDAGYVWLRRVIVDVFGSRIVLSGIVPSFHIKQMALRTAQAVSGVVEVRNEIGVETGVTGVHSADEIDYD